MRYYTEELEGMTKEELIEVYRESGNGGKKDILKKLADSRKFAVLIEQLTPVELVTMAKIHPYKEVIADTMIQEMESHGAIMTRYANGNTYEKDSFEEFMEMLQYKNFWATLKEAITKKPALPETMPKKIEQIRKLAKIEARRTRASGQKMEKLETQDLGKAVDESRVEVNHGEMAKIFDRYAKEARKIGKFFGQYGQETDLGLKLKNQIIEEYISIFGRGKEDIAKLIAIKEFESYSGEELYLPYGGTFRAKSYDDSYNKSIGGAKDNRGWQKNLLEIEQVQGFTVGEHKLGKVFIVKSEFSPTSYAIKDKWAPVFEYYKKAKSGELLRIGSAKINPETGKMETTLSLNKADGSVIRFDSNEYTGNSMKISRKDIEQAITTKCIQKYIGKGKAIADLTQVRDLSITSLDEKGNQQSKNVYAVGYVDNGFEQYEMVCIGEDGKCEAYPGMEKDIFAKKEIHLPTGESVGLEKHESLNILDRRKALETFKTKDQTQYSVFRDEEGRLRVAQIIERFSGKSEYAEELDTYSLINEDIKKIKEQTNKEPGKSITLQQAKNKEKTL